MKRHIMVFASLFALLALGLPFVQPTAMVLAADYPAVLLSEGELTISIHPATENRCTGSAGIVLPDGTDLVLFNDYNAERADTKFVDNNGSPFPAGWQVVVWVAPSGGCAYSEDGVPPVYYSDGRDLDTDDKERVKIETVIDNQSWLFGFEDYPDPPPPGLPTADWDYDDVILSVRTGDFQDAFLPLVAHTAFE